MPPLVQQDLFDRRRRRKNPRPPVALESQDQEALFRWAGLQIGRYPELRWLMHVPNGGGRTPWEGLALKRRGVRPGVADIFLPAMRNNCGGLWIELKREGCADNATEKQRQFLMDMKKAGYRAEICAGWEMARDVIVEYLKETKV